MWIPYFYLETKIHSKERHKPKKDPYLKRSVPLFNKAMITVFWDCYGVILINYLRKGTKISAEYFNFLSGPLRQARQDNVRPHTAHQTKDFFF